MSPRHGQGMSRARGGAGRAGLSTDTLVAAMAGQRDPRRGGPVGTERGFALQIKAGTHPPPLLPALPTRSSAGLVLGSRGAQHILPQRRQHLFIAAPGPPPATDTARRSLTPKRGGLIGHQPRGGGSCPPGLSPAVAAGSGVVAQGREQTRASPRGAVGGTMGLCVAGTIGDGKPRQENKGLRDGMTRCRLALPLPGTAVPQRAGLPEPDDAAGQPLPVPEAFLHRVRAGLPLGTRWPRWHLRFPPRSGVACPRRHGGGGCGRGQAVDGPRCVPFP